MKIHNIYASLNGQTEKIAMEIEKTCLQAGYPVSTIDICKQDEPLDLLAATITFIGSGVYTWLPGKQMLKWIDINLAHARENGQILPGSPRIPEKYVCIYCTYAGPHTGESEAIPAIKYIGQLFDHMGITIADEWAVPAAFIPKTLADLNSIGRLGNIQDRPNNQDLKTIREKTLGLLHAFSANKEK